MNTDIFNLKIEFGSHVGEGYVELIIDDETYMLTSDESFDIRSGTKILVSSVPSYGNDFVGWQGDIDWMTESIYEDSRILTGQIASDVELIVRFKESDPTIYKLPNDDLSETEEEVLTEEPKFGTLSIKTSEGGSFILRTDGLSVMLKSESYVDYPIRVGASVQLLGTSEHGYVFTGVSGDAHWLSGGYGRMHDGEFHVVVEFEEGVEPEIVEEVEVEEEEDDEESQLRLQPRQRLKQLLQQDVSNIADADESKYLSFGGMLLPQSTDMSSSLEVPEGPVVILLEHNPDWRTGHYLVNGEKFHDLVLIRGVQYKFKVTGDAIEGDILDKNLETYDLSTEGGNGTSEAKDLVFTPNENTPEELTYRTKQGNHVLGKIHVRSGVYYGRVTAYGYVKQCAVTYPVGDGYELSMSGNLGEFRIADSGSEFTETLTATGGVDIYSNIPTQMSYTTVKGSTQINALTTLFAKISGASSRPLYSLNDKLRYALGITVPCDILNVDPIHEILIGNVEYMVVYKKLVILNALTSFVNYAYPDKLDVFYSKNVNKFIGTSELQFGEEGVISDLLRPVGGTAVSSILANLFGWVNNLDTVTYLPNWYKLFAFGRTFEQNFLEALKKTANGTEPSASQDAYDIFTAHLGTATTGIIYPELPSEVVIETGFECDAVNAGLLSPIMKKTLDGSFFDNVTGGKTMHINTLKYLFGNVISAEYGENRVCYSISTFPVEYTPNLPAFPGTIVDYGYESIDTCCSDLPTNIFPDPTPKTEDVNIFSFRLIESGGDALMYSANITTKNYPIEYLGNDEYRVYLHQLVSAGDIPEASPGYFIVPKHLADQMEQRYLKVGYNSGTAVKQIFLAILDKTTVDIHFTMMTQRGLMSCYALAELSLKAGDTVSFSDASHGRINKEFMVAAVTSPTLFTVFVNMETEETSDDYTALNAKVVSFGGTRIYCDVSGLAEGDTVVFDKTADGLTYNIDTLGFEEGLGNYFSIAKVLPVDVKKVVKSHVIDVQDEVVEFMFTGKTQYYSVTGADTVTERLWLTYEPDTSPKGRKNHTISYIQFFYNKLEWEG
jgi:hypothetical protein